MSVEVDNGAGADQRENVGFEAAHHSLGVAWCPLGRHFRVPVQRNAFKGSAFDHGFRLGLVLGLYGINAIRQHSLDLQALAARIGEANDGVVAERGQSFPSVGFDVTEPPAFAAIGLD
ncbi:hypothetical protein D3C86_1310270 [compost metagenome]